MLSDTLGFGAAVAIAVGGAPGAAGATAAMHAKVTGMDYARQLSVKPLPDVSGVLDRRRETWGSKQEASDARASGRYRNAFDAWEYQDGRMHFTDGTYTLTNARGKWQAAFFGTRSADGSHYFLSAAYGTGAYKGLRYRFVVHDEASGTAGAHTFDIDGWIERATPAASEAAATRTRPAAGKGTGTASSPRIAGTSSSSTRSGPAPSRGSATGTWTRAGIRSRARRRSLSPSTGGSSRSSPRAEDIRIRPETSAPAAPRPKRRVPTRQTGSDD